MRIFIERIDDASLCLQIVQLGSPMNGEVMRANLWRWFEVCTHMCAWIRLAT